MEEVVATRCAGKLHMKAAELRNSAVQPEAKGSPCVGCMYYTDSTGSWVFACPKCTKKAAQPEAEEGKDDLLNYAIGLGHRTEESISTTPNPSTCSTQPEGKEPK